MMLICRDFAVGYLVTAVVLIGGSLLLRALGGIDLTRATVLLILVLATCHAGARHGRRTAEPPTSGYCWRASLWMLAIALGFTAALAGVAALIVPAELAATILEKLQGFTVKSYIIGAVILIGVYLVAIRFSFAHVARTAALKSRRKKGPDPA